MYIWRLKWGNSYAYFTEKQHAIDSIKTSYSKKKYLNLEEENESLVGPVKLDIRAKWKDSEGWEHQALFSLEQVVDDFVHDRAIHL